MESRSWIVATEEEKRRGAAIAELEAKNYVPNGDIIVNNWKIVQKEEPDGTIKLVKEDNYRNITKEINACARLIKIENERTIESQADEIIEYLKTKEANK